VLYYKLVFDNINGQKIYAQMARPVGGTSFPAIINLQYAGVYGLPKENVTTDASRGWLSINVMAHPYPYDQPAEYYTALEAPGGALNNYTKIGATSRDTSYFLGMLLGDIRAAAYIASRSDWDGETLVTSGTSQGGYQAVMLAGLEPRVTAVLAKVPAGAESAGNFAGRGFGWPYWTQPNGTNAELIKETSRYYDIVNFAPRVTASTLIGMGLIDTTCPASGVSAMINELAGPKEIVIAPLDGHSGTHAQYNTRRGAWYYAIRDGNPIPIANLLAAPTVQAAAINDSSILLQWTNNAVSANGYVMEYTTTQGSGWQTLAQFALGTTSYIHSGLSPGTHYFYRIRAIAPPTATPPIATTSSPASNNVLASASTQAAPEAGPEPRVFYRLRIEHDN
jgi:cephalosporin-C deacetylase-like acetyl esterase